jgi:hypothetical protein
MLAPWGPKRRTANDTGGPNDTPGAGGRAAARRRSWSGKRIDRKNHHAGTGRVGWSQYTLVDAADDVGLDQVEPVHHFEVVSNQSEGG